MHVTSKLPKVGTTIFSVMSALARQHQAINLSQGFPNFDCPEALKALVSKAMTNGFNQYAPMAGYLPLRERLAEKISSLYQAQVDPEQHITVTAGATQALYTAISTFIHPGDEVILIEPAYDSYRPAVEVNGGIPVIYELSPPNYQIDWEVMRGLFTDKTRMIILNTPHNPSGTTWKAEDWLQLQSLVKDTNILILSDEVYEHLTYDGQAHQSVLCFPELWQRSIATFSFGKTFHNTGWKVGYCVAPTQLMQEFRKVHQFNVFSVNTPVQHGLAAYLENPDHYLSLPSFYQQKRDFFAQALQDSGFELFPCSGTYFQTAGYSKISQESDIEFAKRMTIEYGVAVIPVSAFYSSKRDDRVIRFCFAKTEDLLEKAGRVLRQIPINYAE